MQCTNNSRLKKRSKSWRTSSGENRWFSLHPTNNTKPMRIYMVPMNLLSKQPGHVKAELFWMLKIVKVAEPTHWPSLKMIHQAKEDEMAVHACHLWHIVQQNFLQYHTLGQPKITLQYSVYSLQGPSYANRPCSSFTNRLKISLPAPNIFLEFPKCCSLPAWRIS